MQEAGVIARVESLSAENGASSPIKATWQVLAWAILFLMLPECLHIFLHQSFAHFHMIRLWEYFAGAMAFTALLVWLHFLPFWLLWTRFKRYPKWEKALLLVYLAGFGLSWQATALRGDGIRSHPQFALIQAGFMMIFTLGLPAFGYVILLKPWQNQKLKNKLLLLFILIGLYFNLFLLTEYKAFHGHLALFTSLLMVIGLFPHLTKPGGKRLGYVLVALSLIPILILYPKRAPVQGNLERFSHIPASLFAALPLADIFALPYEYEIDPEHVMAAEAREHLVSKYQRIQEEAYGTAPEARARNLVLIILESTPSRVWSDPKIAPRFQQWKRHGVYLPHAVAQYPATPLAYGALFTGQPPSVLVQTPHWAKRRLFDHLRPSFDKLILTKPKSRWFETSTITDFFVEREVPVHAHRTAGEGLNFLKQEISRMSPTGRFFAWAHLYEPHDPYKTHRQFKFPKTALGAYQSEVALLDWELGKFMDWFHNQPAWRDTLVVVIADHGEGLGETIFGQPFWRHHVHVHNYLALIPAFIAGPGLPRGMILEETLFTQMDVMPTFFDALGAKPPADFLVQGLPLPYLILERPKRSLISEAFSIRGIKFFEFVAVAGSMSPAESRRQFAEILKERGTYSSKIALFNGADKLVYDRMLRRHWLYDLEGDLYEQTDLAVENPQKLQKMKALLEDWVREQNWVVRNLNQNLEP